MATHGKQRFFDEESDIRDVRRSPIRYAGYSISYRRSGMRERLRDGHSEVKWHSHIQIDRPRYLEYKDHILEIATRRTAEQLAAEISRLPFEPYAPVRRQLLTILRAANLTRKTAGLEQLPYDVLRYRRNIVKPFEPVRKYYEYCDVDCSADLQAIG